MFEDLCPGPPISVLFAERPEGIAILGVCVASDDEAILWRVVEDLVESGVDRERACRQTEPVNWRPHGWRATPHKAFPLALPEGSRYFTLCPADRPEWVYYSVTLGHLDRTRGTFPCTFID